MENQYRPIQKIIFGSPGTGKSYEIAKIAEKQLNIKRDGHILSNTIKIVFHPEYTYSDFMGKLLPISNGNSVVYKYYPGHFLQVLGMAYRDLTQASRYGDLPIIELKYENYLLVIDELNRGNAAAIFGSIFQLLDRDNDGWSTYEIDISEMEAVSLFDAMGYETEVTHNHNIRVGNLPLEIFIEYQRKRECKCRNEERLQIMELLSQRKIKIPPNLSIIATINTSDESIYYLDSAFKRRWDWEYVDAPSNSDITSRRIPPEILKLRLYLSDNSTLDWYRCIVGVNKFIKFHHHSIRRIEDKQIGWWFIKPNGCQLTLKDVQDKLMFYLWDGVFTRNKQSLAKFIEDKLEKRNVILVTYGDFIIHTEDFMRYWHNSVDAVIKDEP